MFNNFTATFSHSDALGGTETSLITSVTTHTLIHAGDFNYPDSTGATDYLAEDTPNADNLPDTIYFSDGTTAAVNIATNATATPVGPASALTFQVTADVTSGWDYIQLPDPGAGYTLYKVVRSDGTVIPVSDQAWQTDVTISPTRRIDDRLRAAHPRRQQHRLVHGVLSTDHRDRAHGCLYLLGFQPAERCDRVGRCHVL